MKQMGSILIAIAGGYFLILILMVVFQDNLLFIPSNQIYQTPADAGLKAEDAWIQTEDGVTLHGWYFPNESAELVVVLSHGNAGNISGRVAIAESLLRSGASVLLYDYRGYGRSEGKPSESGLYKDIDAVLSYLKGEKSYTEREMVMYGRSLGGAVAAYAAAKYDVRGLVLDSAFLNLRAMIRDVYPFVPSVLAKYRFPTDQYVKNLAPGMPVVVLHSPGDRIVNINHGRNLAGLIEGPVRFVELRGGHNDNFFASRDLMEETWTDFIRSLIDQSVIKDGNGQNRERP